MTNSPPSRRAPCESLRLPPDEQTLVERRYRSFRATIQRLRTTFARRRFGLLDASLGAEVGFISEVISNRRSLTVDRLIAITVSLLGSLAPSLARAVLGLRDPRFPGAPPASAFARMFPAGSDSGPPSEPRLESLRSWVDQLEVGQSATLAPPDRHDLLQLSNQSPSKARRALVLYFDLVDAAPPQTISEDAARNTIWAIGIYGALLRRASQFSLSASYLDLAFVLEARIDCLATRAFLFRSAAYLCAESEQLEMAEVFANHAMSLCFGTPRHDGVAESLFVMALVTFWRGDFQDAKRYLSSASSHAESASPTLRRAIALEHLWMPLATGDLESAAAAHRNLLQPLLGDAATPAEDRARILLAIAVLQSHRNQVAEATANFEHAQNLLVEPANPTDVGALVLWRCYHRLRHGLPHGPVAEILGLADRYRKRSRRSRVLRRVTNLIRDERLTAARLLPLIWTFAGPRVDPTNP